jgi:hypothetical protein
MVKASEIKTIIQHALACIVEEQQQNGGFLSFSSSDPQNFSRHKVHRTTFFTSTILHTVAPYIRRREMSLFLERSVTFLEEEKSVQATYNYWQRSAPETKDLPYPDDLDDTIAAFIALASCDPTYISGGTMAAIVSVLTTLETQEGGPYRTWLVPPDSPAVWTDVDMAVNCNIGFFFSLYGVSLPGLENYIEKKVAALDFTSPYYFSSYPVLYYLSRFYRGAAVPEIIKFIISQRNNNGSWGNPLQTALAISALLRWNYPEEDLAISIEYIANQWQTELWQPYAFCLDPASRGKKYYAGSRALTASFCAEAFQLYLDKINSFQVLPREAERASETDKIRAAIIVRAKTIISTAGPELALKAEERIEKTIRTDTNYQIGLLGFFFREGLNKELRSKVSNTFVKNIGAANILGWTAYSIYDDFFDAEGQAVLLPVANLCLRELTSIYSLLIPRSTSFYDEFVQAMNRVEQANIWEIENFHMENRGLGASSGPSWMRDDGEMLAAKSFGHALPALAILYKLGYARDSKQMEGARNFFRHYLIARQLNDDAHDWVEDMMRFQINSVGQQVLARAVEKGMIESGSILEPISIINPLRDIFWNEVMNTVSRDIRMHIRQAKKFLRDMDCLEDSSYFLKMLVPLQKAAAKALEERDRTLEFIQHYQKNKSMRA